MSRRVLPPVRAWSMPETQRFLLLSIVIGVSCGLIVVLFHVAIEWLSWMTLGVPAGTVGRWAVVAPALGGGGAALLVRYMFPAARGSGVHHTKSAIYVSDGYLPASSVWGKFAACSLSIGTGNPLGPEDPALQMGAGVASVLGRAFRLSRVHMRLIAPLGAAAGIAAAFNTPITAVLFVIEEILAGWNAGVLGSIVLAAVSAVVVSRSFLGDEPLFRVPEFALTHPSELIVYALLGIAGGLAGAALISVMGGIRARLRAATSWRLAQPFISGLVVGAVGLAFPEILGSGYPTVDAALHGEFAWQHLLLFSLLKGALVALVFAAGAPGGLFAPTLFIGAMLGGGIGGLALNYWPAPTSSPSAYVLVGMGILFAAMFRTPMTSIFMVFEVSATYAIILPVMIANVLAYLVSRSLQPESVFDLVGRQDNIPLPSAERERQAVRLHVEDVMHPVAAIVELAPDTPVAESLARVQARPGTVAVVSQSPHAWVPVSVEELEVASRLDGATPVRAIVHDRKARSVYPDESIDSALRVLSRQSAIPVVSRARPPRLLGVLTVAGVLEAYGRQP